MVEVIARLAHLAPDAIGDTVDCLDLYLNAIVGQHLTDLGSEGFQTLLLAFPILLDQAGNQLVLMGTTVAEAEVFQFYLHVVEPQAVCQWCIKEVSLSGNLHLLVGRHAAQCAHIVKAVGKLHQEGSDVIVDGVEHLFVVVHLLGDFIVPRALLGHDAD